MSATVPVRVRDCACPDTPHAEEGDIVMVSPTLSFAGGLAAEQALAAAADAVPLADNASKAEQERVGLARLARVQPDWLRIFVEHGAVGSNFLPEPFDPKDILADYSIARIVSDAVADLGYGQAVLAPFLTPPARRSPPGQTGTGGTSRLPTPTPTRRKSSSRRASAAGMRSVA